MTAVTGFAILALLMMAAALCFAIAPLLRPKTHRAESGDAGAEEAQAQAAIAVLREQMAELEAARQAGTVDDITWQNTREELQRRVLEEGVAPTRALDTRPARGLALALVAGMVAITAAGYWLLGTPQGIDPANTRAQEEEASMQDMESAIDSLAQRLFSEGGSPGEWYMLARSWATTGKYEQAVQAYEKLLEQQPDDPDVLASMGEAIAMQHGEVTPRAEELAHQALQADPDNITALLLAGSAANKREEWEQAAGYFERVLAQIPPEQEDDISRSLRATVNQLRTKAGLPELPQPPGQPKE